ncbi:GNAT family N-acetyltransferase [Pedobacter steynii]
MESANLMLNGCLITIREFDIAIDSIDEITILLHKSYKRLADLGLQFWAATQTNSQTLERIRDGNCYIALRENKIIGTICFYSLTNKDDSLHYKRQDVGRFGQFAVDTDYQKIGLGKALLDMVEDYSRSIGKKHLAMDTSEKAYHLIDYYNKLGFKHVEYIQWERVNYRSTVMSKSLIEF